MADGKYIAYYRVSTDQQGKSGLGLDAQKAAVAQYLNGGDWDLAEEYIEVESGKRSDRPELSAAVSACKRLKATLVIAKLDRLARNVHFVSGLMESGVKFVAVDMPSADPFMLHVYAAMAEEEGRRNKVEADLFAESIEPIIRRMRNRGLSIRAITNQMNADKVPTAKGGAWHVPTVHRLLKRLDRRIVEAA